MAMGSMVTMAIPDVAFSAVGSAAILYVVCSTIGLLTYSYTSCSSLF